MIRRSVTRHSACGALLAVLAHVSAASATGLDDVADRQLGQPSLFTRGVNFVDARGLAYPADVAIDRTVTPNRLYVADTENHRVLGWNDAAGFETGAPADLVIGQPDFASSRCADPPSAASLCAPRSVAVDKLGTLYVADSGAHRVLAYETPFTTDSVADVVFGQSGDFTTAVCDSAAGSLCQPIAVAVDVATNLYVIDASNERILAYAKPVLFEDTVADLVIPATCGAVSASSLCQPRDLAVDADGNLYVADLGHNRVLEYDVPTGGDTTADRVFGQGGNFTTSACNAGGRSADSLCVPFGVAVADDGSLLVSDSGNNRVLVYDTPITDDVTADRVIGQGGDFTTGTGHCNDTDPRPSGSGLCEPYGLDGDGDGRSYVADANNHRVLAFDAPGTGDPFASRVLGQTSLGNGGQNLVDARALAAPTGVALDRSVTPARLYVADGANHRVLAWADAGGFASGAPADLVVGQADLGVSGCNRGGRGAASLCVPRGIAVDAAGNLYVADSENSRVLEYDTPFATDGIADRVFGQGADFTTAACGPTGLCKPTSVALDAAGNLYVADTEQHRVLEYDAPLTTDTAPDRVFGQRGSFATTGCNEGGRDTVTLCRPTGVGVDPSGNLYVADRTNNRVLEYDVPLTTDVTADRVFGQSGSFTTDTCNPVPGDPNTFCAPNDVTTDAAGNLWIVFDVEGRIVELDRPLTTGDDLVDHVFGEVGTGTSGCDDAVGTTPRSLCGPQTAAVDATGNVYVADAGGRRVVAYDSPLPLTPSAAKAARKCQQTIVKASAAFVQATTSARRKCEEAKIKGKGPACPDPKTTAAQAKLRAKLATTIAKACCGADKQCTGGGDDQTLVDIGWNVGGCPTFARGGCTNRIADADDVTTCLACVGEGTVGDVIDLTYGSLVPSDPKAQKALNGCQLAIGKGATTVANASSKTLAKCWDAVSKGKAAGPDCPDAAGAAKIAAARAKAIDKTCKACGGGGDKAPVDGHCDAASTLDPQTDIGFPEDCLATPFIGPIDCGDFATETVDDMIACIDCATNVRANCADRAAVPAFAPYPLECRP